MPTKRPAAFIGLPSPLGRGEFGGNARIDGWAAEYVGYKMHTSSPSFREDGHSETRFTFLGFWCLLRFSEKGGIGRRQAERRRNVSKHQKPKNVKRVGKEC